MSSSPHSQKESGFNGLVSFLSSSLYPTCVSSLMEAIIFSKKKANVTPIATANVRLAALLVSLLVKDGSQLSKAILAGCFVVGGPIRDIYRWVRAIWFGSSGIYGKAPDDIDLSTDPSQFLFLGEDFMEKICLHLVSLLDGQVFLGDIVHANKSGPDSGTYKINIQWGPYTGANQITLDLSQFKSEKNDQITLNAGITEDAFRRDLTLNALYCSLADSFSHVAPSASEETVWFQFLLSMTEAYFSGKILDPTGSGFFTLQYDLVDLCGVREAYLLFASKLCITGVAGLPDTASIRRVLVDSGIPESELHGVEDTALNIIFNEQNFIRAFRLLRDLMKGATMQPWLQNAIERWVERFIATQHTDAEMQSKLSLFLEKLPKLVPCATSIPPVFHTLTTFFLESSGTGKAVLYTLLRDASATVENVQSWATAFPMILQEDPLRPPLTEAPAIPFLLRAVRAGFSVSAAISYWWKPVVKGSVITLDDPTFPDYKKKLEAHLEEQLVEQMKKDPSKKKSFGVITDKRVLSFANDSVVARYREEILEKFLSAGPAGFVTVSGSVEEPKFAFEVRVKLE